MNIFTFRWVGFNIRWFYEIWIGLVFNTFRCSVHVSTQCTVPQKRHVGYGFCEWCSQYYNLTWNVKEYIIFVLNHNTPLRENCPNTDFFLVLILLYLSWKQENSEQKKLCIWALHAIASHQINAHQQLILLHDPKCKRLRSSIPN